MGPTQKIGESQRLPISAIFRSANPLELVHYKDGPRIGGSTVTFSQAIFF